jgi:hypothetical protein
MARAMGCTVTAGNTKLLPSKFAAWLVATFRYEFKFIKHVIKKVMYISKQNKVGKNLGFGRKFKFWILS